MNPLRDGGGGKEDPLTTRVIGRPYIRRRCHITIHSIPYAVVEAAFMVVDSCLWSIDILVEEHGTWYSEAVKEFDCVLVLRESQLFPSRTASDAN